MNVNRQSTIRFLTLSVRDTRGFGLEEREIPEGDSTGVMEALLATQTTAITNPTTGAATKTVWMLDGPIDSIDSAPETPRSPSVVTNGFHLFVKK